VPAFVPFLALGIVAAVVLIGLVVGTSMRTA
jgi:hypothetical protein